MSRSEYSSRGYQGSYQGGGGDYSNYTVKKTRESILENFELEINRQKNFIEQLRRFKKVFEIIAGNDTNYNDNGPFLLVDYGKRWCGMQSSRLPASTPGTGYTAGISVYSADVSFTVLGDKVKGGKHLSEQVNSYVHDGLEPDKEEEFLKMLNERFNAELEEMIIPD